MQKRDLSKSVKAILDKFQIELDSGAMTLEDIQEWCQEINFLLNAFIQEVTVKLLEFNIPEMELAHEPIKPENEVDIYS